MIMISNDFIIPFSRYNSLNQHPIIKFARLWNQLPEDIKSISETYDFLLHLNKHLFSVNSIDKNCNKENCKICNPLQYKKRLLSYLQDQKKLLKYPKIYF